MLQLTKQCNLSFSLLTVMYHIFQTIPLTIGNPHWLFPIHEKCPLTLRFNFHSILILNAVGLFLWSCNKWEGTNYIYTLRLIPQLNVVGLFSTIVIMWRVRMNKLDTRKLFEQHANSTIALSWLRKYSIKQEYMYMQTILGWMYQ